MRSAALRTVLLVTLAAARAAEADPKTCIDTSGAAATACLGTAIQALDACRLAPDVVDGFDDVRYVAK